MSGIIAIYHRDRSPVESDEAQPLLAALAHRGPDGSRCERSLFVAVAHLHHWTTPEEIGERQPLVAAGRGCVLTFDGRLDNRNELARALGRSGDVGSFSDAAVVLQAYEKWGEDCFSRLLGPFAIVVHDIERHRLLCARDPLGSRTLFYHANARCFIAASEECAVLAHPAVEEAPDRRRLAWHMALRVPSDGSTFFRGVHELLPGELLVVGEEDLRRSRFRRPRAVAGLGRLSDAECAECFAELLERSVSDRLRGVGAPAVLMSGGLDSTAVAALACRSQRRSGAEPPMPISWVFDELPDCDERRFIEPVSQAIGVRPVMLNGDHSWPLRGQGDWAANPNTPEENPYRLLKTAAYDTAAKLGSRVLLTGGGGDQLWTGAAWWLADLLAAGRPLTAAGELAREFGRHRGRALGGIRRALRLPAMRRGPSAGWLSPEARRHLPTTRDRPAAASRRREKWQGLLGAREARGATIEIFHSARAGIELRHPFRDLRLVEFALGLPAHQGYRAGRKKHLLRVAMRGLLPPEVLGRHSVAGLAALYRRGVEERERARVRDLLSVDSSVRRMVRPEWTAGVTGRARSASEELALWQLLALELWHRRQSGVGEAELRRTA